MFKVIYKKNDEKVEDLLNFYEFIFFLFYCKFSRKFILVSIKYLEFYDREEGSLCQ